MKKLIILAICLFASIASAQTWHTTNQATLAWEAVAPIAEGDTIKYQVYTKFGSAEAEAVKVGEETLATQQTIGFSTEGRYYLCVDAARYIPNEPEAQRSALACSHDPLATKDGVPFGVKYFHRPTGPSKLQIVR